MRIGIDFDDTLSQFMAGFLAYHNGVYGTSFAQEQITHYDLHTVLPLTHQEIKERVHNFIFSSHHASLSPYPGVASTLGLLARYHELYVVTSRGEEYKEPTLRWLSAELPGSFRDFHFTNQWTRLKDVARTTKPELCVSKGIELIIEDSASHANHCAEKGVRAFLLERPWNVSVPTHPHVQRVTHWDDIARYLSGKL